ncbi:hypothetical protein EL45_11090 [Cellulophaga sp. E6(2014)]|nr:hypothetical protein EL45_11090 [Cellulophaga sp. E6(2014)]
MMSYFNLKINSSAVRITYYSFLINTIFFLINLAVDAILMLKIIIAVIIGLMNVILLITAFFNTLINYKYYEENISTLLIIIINLTIGIIYLYI